jgi:leucyl/phenylalanyl-tRNA--protein transferase
LSVLFPDPQTLPEHEQIALVGGELSVTSLREAYARGIFPWPTRGLPMLWHCPNPRGVLDFATMHIPRSLKQTLKKGTWRFTFNRDFRRVIEACAQQPRDGQDDTWILPDMVDAYVAFHEAGYAHSVECWLDDKLAGGLYGVYIDGSFSGESMFHSATGASKLALWALAKELERQGLSWMDVQMVTPVLKLFGGQMIEREAFLGRLQQARMGALPPTLALPDEPSQTLLT